MYVDDGFMQVTGDSCYHVGNIQGLKGFPILLSLDKPVIRGE